MTSRFVLRRGVGDGRRVLVGFDQGGWFPILFRDMHTTGFDTLTWRKGPTPELPEAAFATVSYADEHGRGAHVESSPTSPWTSPLTDGIVFAMRQQVTRRKTRNTTSSSLLTLTIRTDLAGAEVVYRMGARWRQENQFRYACIHPDLDSHVSYTTTPDDHARLVVEGQAEELGAARGDHDGDGGGHVPPFGPGRPGRRVPDGPGPGVRGRRWERDRGSVRRGPESGSFCDPRLRREGASVSPWAQVRTVCDVNTCAGSCSQHADIGALSAPNRCRAWTSRRG